MPKKQTKTLYAYEGVINTELILGLLLHSCFIRQQEMCKGAVGVPQCVHVYSGSHKAHITIIFTPFSQTLNLKPEQFGLETESESEIKYSLCNLVSEFGVLTFKAPILLTGPVKTVAIRISRVLVV